MFKVEGASRTGAGPVGRKGSRVAFVAAATAVAVAAAVTPAVAAGSAGPGLGAAGPASVRRTRRRCRRRSAKTGSRPGYTDGVFATRDGARVLVYAFTPTSESANTGPLVVGIVRAAVSWARGAAVGPGTIRSRA